VGIVVPHTQKFPSGRIVYRRPFPEKLRPFILKREFKVPLGREGSLGFFGRWEKADAEFAAIVARAERQLVGDYDKLDAPTIAYIVEAYLVDELEADTLRRWDADAKSRAQTIGDVMRDAGLPMPTLPADAAGRWTQSVRYAASTLVEAGKSLRAHGDLEGIVDAWRDTAVRQAEKGGYVISSEGVGFAELCIAMNDAAISAHEAMLERLDGAHIPTPSKPGRPVPKDIPAGPVAFPMLEAFDQYAKAKGLAAGTVYEWRKFISNIIAFVGHDDGARLRTDDVLRWRNHLLETPNARGVARNPKTVRGTYLSALKALLGWAVQERKLPVNVADPVVVHVPKAVKLRDRDFTTEEASAILTASLIPVSGNLAKGHVLARRWVPWLAAYTGARVNELSQLRGQDVYETEGLWVLRITPEAGTVKGKAARIVPLHPHLIEQGFPEVAKAFGDAPLFYEPDSQRVDSEANRHFKKVGERIAKWVRDDVGITDPAVQPSHAWRHTFKTKALAAGVPERIADAIQGHAARTVSRSYGSVPLKTMADAISSIPRFI
jgi:integrase